MTKKLILIMSLAFATCNVAFGQTDNQNDSTKYRGTLTEQQFNAMKDYEISFFLQNYEKGDIYKTFRSGERLAKTGKRLFTAGVICSTLGLMGILYGLNDAVRNHYANAFESSIYVFGILGLSVGEGLIIASIPIRIVGGVKKRITKENYVNQYLKSHASLSQTTLSVGLTQGGIGLTLHF